MELTHLRTFVAVAEHGGFRRAAVRLHFSQPAVTAHIRNLERSLGTSLFHRHPAGVELTPAGTRLLATAQRLLDLSDAATRMARRDQFDGSLRLGAFPASAAELTRPLLVELRRSWPAATLNIVSLELSSSAPAVEGIDALITRDPIDRELVRATELFSEQMRIAVPWHWPARQAGRLTLEEALALPLVRPAASLPADVCSFWSLASLRGDEPVDYRGYGAYCLEDFGDDIVGGFGAAFTTVSILRFLAESRFRSVPFDYSPTTRTWLTSRADDHRPVIEALHREVAQISARIGPLVLPELASGANADPLV